MGNTMESNGNIAQISFEPKTHSIKDIRFFIGNLRFKCKRCATFCCKLGGPKLTADDIERLKQAGYDEAEFRDDVHGSLKNRADGSCVFLQLTRRRDVYECSVYDSRPVLCRLYPFYFQRMNQSHFTLKIMPCRGISRHTGEPVDERFITYRLIDNLRDSASAKLY